MSFLDNEEPRYAIEAVSEIFLRIVPLSSLIFFQFQLNLHQIWRMTILLLGNTPI